MSNLILHQKDKTTFVTLLVDYYSTDNAIPSCVTITDINKIKYNLYVLESKVQILFFDAFYNLKKMELAVFSYSQFIFLIKKTKNILDWEMILINYKTKIPDSLMKNLLCLNFPPKIYQLYQQEKRIISTNKNLSFELLSFK